MALYLIPISATVPGARTRLEETTEDAASLTELLEIVRATQELLNIRSRLLDYIVALSAWPEPN
jgi:hypothetical protein